VCQRAAHKAILARSFWATLATHALHGGIDLRTVQVWMGHTDLVNYSLPAGRARGEKVQAQVEALWA
jgi:hypothetical protein